MAQFTTVRFKTAQEMVMAVAKAYDWCPPRAPEPPWYAEFRAAMVIKARKAQLDEVEALAGRVFDQREGQSWWTLAQREFEAIAKEQQGHVHFGLSLRMEGFEERPDMYDEGGDEGDGGDEDENECD